MMKKEEIKKKRDREHYVWGGGGGGGRHRFEKYYCELMEDVGLRKSSWKARGHRFSQIDGAMKAVG